ncbi:MAG: ribonuclease HII, partial [Coriobacteriales bacterium]|nr:ribonuclease HII [Coriobacteriales bacterium]
VNTGLEPDLVLIDGNPVHIHERERCIVKGDGKVACIAAASIVAKVTRDAIMVKADAEYPGYGFSGNKGYASAAHIAAIRELGLTDFHRHTFCRNFFQQQMQI